MQKNLTINQLIDKIDQLEPNIPEKIRSIRQKLLTTKINTPIGGIVKVDNTQQILEIIKHEQNHPVSPIMAMANGIKKIKFNGFTLNLSVNGSQFKDEKIMMP